MPTNCLYQIASIERPVIDQQRRALRRRIRASDAVERLLAELTWPTPERAPTWIAPTLSREAR